MRSLDGLDYLNHFVTDKYAQMDYSIDSIYKKLDSPRNDASFFKALVDECRAIGRESKNENLTETAFYQVASTMTALYRDRKISASAYSAIAYVYQEWAQFRLDIGNVDGWRELSKMSEDVVIEPSPSEPKGGKSTHPGIFIAIVAVILFVCIFLIFKDFSSDTIKAESVQEHVTQEKTVPEKVAPSLPSDLTGLYFVQKSDGISVKGTIARISEKGDNQYDMTVYSNMPVKHYSLTLNRAKGLFHSEALGDGIITYDEQTRTTTINFSDLWVLTN